MCGNPLLIPNLNPTWLFCFKPIILVPVQGALFFAASDSHLASVRNKEFKPVVQYKLAQ